MLANLFQFPQLQTQRLLLRQLSITDAGEIFSLRSNDSVNKYLARTKANSIEDAKDFINRINAGMSNNQSLYWAICFRDQKKAMGTICLWNFSAQENKAEIGYELLPEYQGRGIMQEAFAKVVEFGFNTLNLTIIEAWTVQQNLNSINILQRNQFERDTELEKKIDRNSEGPDCIIFSLSRKTYSEGRL